MKKNTFIYSIICFMLLSTQCIIAQTEFTSLGAADSGGTGFKTTNISEIVVSNDYNHDTSDIFGTANGILSTETLTLKADGTNAESFTLDDLNVYHFGGSTTYSGATIVFKDKTGTTLQTMSSPGSLSDTSVSIGTLFTMGNTLPITNVAEITITITGGTSPSNFTLDNITISNPVTPVACTEPDVPTVMADAICTGSTATLNIMGDLNDATQWVVYSDAAGTSTVTTSTSTATEVTIANVSATTTYYVRGEGGCATPGTLTAVEVTVNALDDATFSYDAAGYGVNSTDPTPTISGVTGGAFSSNIIGLSINSTTGLIDLSASTPGDYMVTYTTNGTCPNSSTVAVSIYALPTITAITDDTGISNTDFITSDNTPTVFGTATPNSTVAIIVNGNSSALFGISTVTDMSGNYSLPFPIVFGTLPDAQAGFSAASTFNGVTLTSNVQAATIDTTAPVFTSATTASAFSGTMDTVYTAIATDATAVTYSISGGDDMAALSITAAGEVTFNTTPDFDSPTDTGMDNTYVVDILATDAAGNTTTQTVTITVMSNAVTWTGATDNDWATASNWNTNMVPHSTADITIPNNLTNYPTSNTSVVFNTLTIDPGASFIPEIAATGITTYNRNIPDTNWHLIASPVAGETFQDIIANHTLAQGSGAQIGLGIYLNDTGVGGLPWFYASNALTGTIPVGFGLSIKLASPGNFSVSGTALAANTSLAIIAGSRDSFNLLGNPYTSYINSATLTAANTAILTEETVWLWDGTEYQTYNAVNPIDIAPTQGFFVEAAVDNTFAFSSTNRSHQSTDTFLRQEPIANFELFVENGTTKNSTKVFYVEGKTTGFDNGYDSKMFGGDEQDLNVFTELITDNEGNKLAIQTLPTDNTLEIPVGLTAKAGEEVTFSIESLNLSEGTEVYLEDKLNNEFVNLSETTYKTTLAEDSNGIGQFYITTTSAKTLSTENVDLNATVSIYKSSNTELTITGLNAKASVKVYSLLGKEVISSSLEANSVNKINLPSLNSGVYIVTLNSEYGTVTKKITLN